jgi:hypothetical protein
MKKSIKNILINKDRLRVLFALSNLDQNERTSCPGPEKMALFLSNNLDDIERESILYHMESCPYCYSEWMTAPMPDKSFANVLHRYMNSIQSLYRTTKDNVYDYLEDLKVLFMLRDTKLSYAYARRDSDDQDDSMNFSTIKKTFNDLTLSIDVEKNEDNHFDLKVDVFQKDKKAENIDISLKGKNYDKRLLLDDYIIFDDLISGDYQMIIKQKTLVKGEYHFTIDNSGLRDM